MPATLTQPETTNTNTMNSIRIYNTLTGEKELFEPVESGKVSIYLCGPTVYKEAHIGHLVGPIIFDTIKRFLTHCGYDVTWIVNLTDVDDKLIQQSQERGISMSQVATEMTMDYCANLLAVGVDQITALPRATDHIDDIVAMIEQLVEKEFAYEVDGDVFFDVLRDKDYGKLSNRSAADQQGEGGGAAAKKRSAGDFALWKAAKSGEPSWDSPWGKGRPGWHIECSAMSKRLLGDTFDIHGGGLDLKFPHHENEIAQSECCHGKPMAKYWVHNGLLRAGTAGKLGGRSDREASSETEPAADAAAKKMSRSGGAGGLRALIAQHGGERLRFFLLRSHYRSTVVFSDDAVAEEGKSLDKFYEFFDRYERVTRTSFYKLSKDDTRHLDLENTSKNVLEIRTAFLEKMADDFNTGAAIAELFQLLTSLNRFADTCGLENPKSRKQADVDRFMICTEVLRELAGILGLFFKAPPKSSGGDDGLTAALMELIIKLRSDAREKKDYATADVIRDALNAANVILEDRDGGTTWKQG